MAKIKLKPKARKGVIGIKALIKHPMETVHMVILHNGNTVVDADIGSSVSKDPYFKFNVPGAKGDEITIKYKDSNGKTGSATKKSK
jgi:sulfur-oxidizing protein SoxZ